MTIGISNLEGRWPVGSLSETQRGEALGTEESGFASDLASASQSTESSPPAAVSAEVREAADAAARLVESGRELRFDHDDDGNLQVSLQDRQGNVLRSVPTSEIFGFAEGKVTS